MLAPLANRTYRNLFAAQVIALFGTGLTTVALTLLAYEIAGARAGIVLGTALALKMIAYVAVAPLAGAFAHRLPRRRLLVTLDVVRAGVVLCLPFVTTVWQIYVLIFVVNACSAVFTPVFQATIPDVLEDEASYTRALSLSRLAYDLENLLSPGAAALALLVMSYDALFVANALAFGASALLVAAVAIPPSAEPERTGPFAQSVAFGLNIYLRTPRLRGLLALSLAVACAGAMMIVNTVVLVRERFGGSEAETAFAFAAGGAGSMVVALVLPRMLERLADRPLMLGGGVMLTAGLACGLVASELVWLLWIWFLLGAGSSLIQTPAGRLLRRSCREGDRAAVFSSQFALSHLCWLITYPLAGLSGVHLGIGSTFAMLSVVCLAAVAIAARLWPRGDPLVVEHDHPALSHDHLHVHDEHHQHEHEGWEGPEPHRHPHRHERLRHRHAFVIDLHHPWWPRA
ncbi:MAG: MFS transporter [Gammaproteobacteria bacterium]|nr:MFS transporter [Gammaproteobacteria bacterium]